jgi:hypothetical protein
MGIALIALALAITCGWAARRGNNSSTLRHKFYWAGMSFTALAFGGAYMQVLEWRSPQEIAAYLPPYPCATVRSRSPITVDHAKAWVLETSHSPRSVGDFYAKVARTNGWQMKREVSGTMEVLVLRQFETVTTVMAMPQRGKTEITYMVRAAVPQPD